MGNYDMTLEQYRQRLQELAKLTTEKGVQRAVLPAASRLLGNIKNRIIREGKNSAGQKIGTYSTKAGYYGKKQFVKQSAFKGQGKGGVKRGAKSMYLEAGYKQLREIQGREGGFMNFEYSGSTLLAYQLQARDTSVVLGITTQKAAMIRDALEKRKGATFTATRGEITTYNKEVSAELSRITRELLTR